MRPFFGIPACAAVLSCLLLLGCPKSGDDLQLVGSSNSSKEDTTNENRDQTSISAAERKRLSQCETRLVQIVDGLSYERLGIDTDPDSQLSDLNNWLTTCGPDDDAEQLTNDSELRQKLLPEGMNPFVDEEHFLALDLAHIRDATLSKAIGEAASTDASDDVQVMVDLFDRVTRNITLVTTAGGEMPLDPTRIWEFGVGTARDRAWVFALLLQQYQLDSVVIEFPGGFNATPYILVAGVSRGEDANAYLFDPITGLPVPDLADDAPVPSKPARWNDAVKNDAIFRALDSEVETYPISTPRFETAQLFFVGDVSVFSERMARLQESLPSGRSLQLYAGLGDNKLAAVPLLERLSTALKVDKDRFRLWPHATSARVTTTQVSTAAQNLLVTRRDVMFAPYTVQEAIDDDGNPIVDETGKPRFVTVPSSMQNSSNILTGRIAQLSGDTKQALRAYLASRVSMFKLTINQVAAADAAYWVALTQYESGRVDHAKSSLEKYLNREFLSIWEASARRLLVTICAQEGDFEAAAKFASGKAVDPGTLALFARWKKQGRLEETVAPDRNDGGTTSPNNEMKKDATSPAKTDESGPAKESAPNKKPAAKNEAASNETSSPEDSKQMDSSKKPAEPKPESKDDPKSGEPNPEKPEPEQPKPEKPKSDTSKQEAPKDPPESEPGPKEAEKPDADPKSASEPTEETPEEPEEKSEKNSEPEADE